MNQISNAADRAKIKQKLGEISSSMTRMSAEKDLIREIVKDISDEFQLPKRQVAKMAKVFHKQSFQQEIQEQEEFEVLYGNIVESK